MTPRSVMGPRSSGTCVTWSRTVRTKTPFEEVSSPNFFSQKLSSGVRVSSLLNGNALGSPPRRAVCRSADRGGKIPVKRSMTSYCSKPRHPSSANGHGVESRDTSRGNFMEHRTLGHSSLSVSAVGLGCMSMSGTYGKGDDAQSIGVVQHGLDQGLNLLDSSDMYGFGHNEELLGKAIRGRRNQVVLTTKFGQGRTPEGKAFVNGRPEYVAQACDLSLKRLGVDVIDLYYQHRVDPSVPIEETVGAMKRLIEQGKVRYLGLCEAAPATIRRAHRIHPISALQSEFSLLYRAEAEATLPTLRELGISFVAYAPLGRSWLSGRVQRLDDIPSDDRRRDHPRFHEANFAKNLELVHRIETIGEERNCTAAPGVAPVTGTKGRERREETVKASEWRLDARDVERIAAAIPAGAAAGTR